MISATKLANLGSSPIGKFYITDVNSIEELRAIRTGNNGYGVPSVENGTIANVDGYYTQNDGGGGQFIFSAYSSLADNGGTIMAPLSGLGRWIRQNQDASINAKWFGAIGDGVANDAPALQSAINYCGSAFPLYIPKGVYIVNSALVSITSIAISGDGRSASTIKAGADGFTVLTCSGGVSVQITDIGFYGYGDRNPTPADNAPRLIVASASNHVFFTRLRGEYARGFSFSMAAPQVKAIDCYIINGSRDGLSATSAQSVIVSDCYFKNLGDDCISIHTPNIATVTDTKRYISISGCHAEMTNGIKILGAHRAIISGNHLERIKGYGIFIGYDATEGLSSMRDITITSNQIRNVLNTSLFGGGASNYGIYLQGHSSPGDVAYNAGGIVPGNFNSVGFVWQVPENAGDYLSGSLAPNSQMTRVLIANNSIVSDLRAVASYDLLGYGDGWNTAGVTNPGVSFIYQTTGIRVNASINNLFITENVLYGLNECIQFSQAAAGIAWRNITIARNFFRRSKRGIDCTQGTPGVFVSECKSIDNNFDLCPLLDYHRDGDGKWNTTGNGDGSAHLLANTSGWVIIGCVFRNVKTAVFSSTLSKISRCVFHFQSDNITFNFKGIWSLGSSADIIHVDEICDPTSADYQKTNRVNDMKSLTGTAMPVIGWFPAGVFVVNTNPTKDGNNMILKGWIRLLTGNAHVSGTDWLPCYVSSVTPAN